jgi:hypothetical protein
MSQEVRINLSDYKTIMSWFERLFGDDNRKPTIIDTKTYQKLAIMQLAFLEEIDFLKSMGDPKT